MEKGSRGYALAATPLGMRETQNHHALAFTIACGAVIADDVIPSR
jgi:hypothetical protein